MKPANLSLKKTNAAEIGNRIHMIRRKAGLSLSDVAERMNREFGASTNKGMLSKYENGIHEPSASTIYCFSKIFGVSGDYILGKSEVMYDPLPKQGSTGRAYNLKVFTRMFDHDTGDVDESVNYFIPTDWLVGGREYFAYRVSGGCQAPRYYDGDIIVFERKTKPRRDQPALVAIGGDEAFLAFITKKRDGKIIKPVDPTYDGMFYSTEELLETPVKILGIAVELRRSELEFTEDDSEDYED